MLSAPLIPRSLVMNRYGAVSAPVTAAAIVRLPQPAEDGTSGFQYGFLSDVVTSVREARAVSRRHLAQSHCRSPAAGGVRLARGEE